MKIVFLGSDIFAVPALEALAESRHTISCVVTQPDRKKGRGLSLSATPVKTAALKYNLPVYQPENINLPGPAGLLKNHAPDVLIVIAYGQILSQEILDIPKILAVNLHASLLPKYRGAAPIHWALIKGESATGVTALKMSRKMDSGPIIDQRKISISETDNTLALEGKLAQAAAQLLLESLENIEKGRHTLTEQNKEEATYAPKIKKDDGLIHWEKPAGEIADLIRGCYGWPGAFTYYKGKRLKIYRALACGFKNGPSTAPGEITKIGKDYIHVATKTGDLCIEELQIESKRRVSTEEFIAGHKIQAGEHLGK
jgi:methionyl-tRNA formyltransferase